MRVAVRVMQRMQSVMQNNLIAKALAAQGPARVPWAMRTLLRIPILRDLLAKLIAFGPRGSASANSRTGAEGAGSHGHQKRNLPNPCESRIEGGM